MPTTRGVLTWVPVIALAALVRIDAAAPQSAGTAALPENPQVLRTAAATIRVSAIKGLVYPWALAFLPNGDMLVTEQGRNTLRLIRKGVLEPTPITGLPQGITSTRRDTAGVDIAVHPRFAENHFVYVAYWKPESGTRPVRTAALVRARYDGGSTLSDVREIFASSTWTDGPSSARLAFAPDGTIFMAIGAPGFAEELGSTAWAQDPREHGGKILRLKDDGSVPADNPFVGRAGYKPEIFALGIRNAIGLTIHPETGELWETENGPQGGDEVNIIRAGRNYGWPLVTYGRAYTSDPEGKKSGLPPPSVQPPTSAPGMEEPVTFYKPSIAISGMVFYTGDKFPLWRGNLIVGGLAGMQLSRLIFNRQGLEMRREAMLLELRQRIRDVRQGPDGFLYVTTDMPDGAILKIEPVTER
ncbi:MAG TPA: PQQ-dependent sugar dehydrogenase [Vicinamibacterales bacterium]|nr:PQQ-dependent sugar dehydrogenase [Vicinamibacterales bacterium]